MVPIQLDKPRHLHFDLPALIELEQRMNGTPTGKIIEQLAQMGLTAIVMSLWAGLKHEDATLTPTTVAQILDNYINSGQSVMAIARALNEAIVQSSFLRNITTVETPLARQGRKRR